MTTTDMKFQPQTAVLTLIGLSGLIVLVTVFFITGYTSGQKVGYDAAKQRLVGYLPESTTSATTLNGTVKEVNEGALVMTVGDVSANPLDPQGPQERKVMVNESTKLSENSPKTTAQLKQDSSVPYILTAITLADLKPGDRVRVSANENIYFAESFTATEVQRLR